MTATVHDLALARACADLASRPPDGMERCSVCGSIELEEAFADCSDLAPFVGLACADCETALLSDLRDELPSERERRAGEARQLVLRPEFAAALGIKEDA